MFSHQMILATAMAALALPAAAEEVVVFAASSLKTALDPVAAAFQEATGQRVTISYAGTNALARQIMEGAPADIFISASVPWLDAVEAGGDVVPGSRRDLLGNQLVLVGHLPPAEQLTLEAATDLSAMLAGGRLAMAMVDSVPAGQYGKEALGHLGLWDKVEGAVAQADNVRAALALVATGEAPLGIVYASDAVAEPSVHVVASFPPDSHTPITYPMALLKNAADPADEAFFEALQGQSARAVFAAQGFTILD